MGRFLSIPILAVAAALQASLIPQIRVLGGGPDLVLLLVTVWALNAELEEAVVWAFVGGIMVDLLSATATGVSSLGLILIVFGISGLGQRVYRIQVVLLVGLVLSGTVLQEMIRFSVTALTGFPINWGANLFSAIAVTAIFNLVLIWPIYRFIRTIQNRLTYRKPYPGRLALED